VGPELLFRDEAQRLTVDRVQCAPVHFGMVHNRQSLIDAGRQCAAQLDMATLLRMLVEIEAGEDTEQILTSRRSFGIKPRLRVP
jgi:hypothetical protein